MDIVSKSSREENDEAALKWAAIERIPSHHRTKSGVLAEENSQQIDVGVEHLGPLELKTILDSNVKFAEEDNGKFLLKLRQRIDR